MGGRLAIVVETSTTHEGQELLKDVQAMSGVGAVLPVFHDFSDEHPEVDPRSEE
ncbi:MAG: hypothetical protein H6722_35090 [Sandaracinus sp.]|nr:hypothetical protein [Sandaracinus sp.]